MSSSSHRREGAPDGRGARASDREERTTVRSCLIILTLLAGASVAEADTQTGVAKRNNAQVWGFGTTSAGETKITLSWTKAGSTVLAVLVCSDNVSAPVTFGVAAGGLNRYGEIVAGVPASSTCVVGVQSFTGPNTPYRIHVNQTTSEKTNSQGRVATAVDSGASFEALRRHAERELQRLSRW